jgi:pimeloyl-ACP methyl ester carboxylesterase
MLFHGCDGPTLSDHGMGGTERLAQHLRAAGFPEVRAWRYNSDSPLLNALAIRLEQGFGTFSRRLTRDILASLRAAPLAPGQSISLVGYSLGTQVAARVAKALRAAGHPVRVVALIEPRNGKLPAAIGQVPLAERVLLVQNPADAAHLVNPWGVPLDHYWVHSRTHMQFLEDPDPGLLEHLVQQLHRAAPDPHSASSPPHARQTSFGRHGPRAGT